MKVNLRKKFSYSEDGNNVVHVGPGEAEVPEKFKKALELGDYLVGAKKANQSKAKPEPKNKAKPEPKNKSWFKK